MGQVYTLPYGTMSTESCYANGMIVVYMENSAGQWNPGKILANTNEVYLAGYPSASVSNQFCYILGSSAGFSITTGIWDSVNHSLLYSGGFTITGDNINIGCPYSTRATFTGDPYWGSTPHWPGAFNHYDNEADAVAAIISVVGTANPITYRLTNCTAPGAPESARSGSHVDILLTPDVGFEFINPSSDIYVTNNGVAVVASYANGHLSFTMP